MYGPSVRRIAATALGAAFLVACSGTSALAVDSARDHTPLARAAVAHAPALGSSNKTLSTRAADVQDDVDAVTQEALDRLTAAMNSGDLDQVGPTISDLVADLMDLVNYAVPDLSATEPSLTTLPEILTTGTVTP